MLTVDGAETGVLFVGDDWAEDHHDIELQDGSGRVLRTARVPEGVAGMARFHELIATFLPDDADPAQVLVCIETDRGPWVRALVAAGYDEAEAVKVVARAHQTLIWERTRHMLRLRAALRDYFPAALEAYKPLGLTGADTLELLAKAPTPAAAAKLTATQIGVALKRARRRDIPAKAAAIRAALRAEHLGQAEVVAGAYAATVRAIVAVLQTLNTEIKTLEGQVEAHFGQHPDAEIYLSQPGLAT